MTGPGVTCRRSDASGNVPSSTAGSDSGSSVGVGACTTGRFGGGTGRPARSTGTAQLTVHSGRSRSSAGRVASSSSSRTPVADRTTQRESAAPSRSTTAPASSIRDSTRPSASMDRSAGSASSSSGSSPASAARTASTASARSGSRTSVSHSPAGTGSAAHGSRSTGTCPSRRSSSSASAGTAATAVLVSAAENRTPPVVECTDGASVTVSTAANPTPNRPTLPPSRLAEARSVASASTPAASSGAPVFAASSCPSTSDSRSCPSTPDRVAASAAFCASSTSSRSRYAPWVRSCSALASSRNRAGEAAQAASTRSRIAAVPNGSGTLDVERRRTLGGGGGDGAASTTASECAPQPASAETTAPSRGEYALPQTPNTARNEPSIGR